MKTFTTKDTAAFVVTRFAREDKSGMEAIAAGIVWGFHNPADLNEVMAGKTPAQFKALRTQIEEKTTPAKARQWSTNVRKAVALILKDTPAMNKSLLPDTLTDSVTFVIEKLAPHGTSAYAIANAHKAAFAPTPVAATVVEDDGAGDGDGAETSAEIIADTVADLMAHGLGADAKQSDIAQIMQFCIERASDQTLAKVAVAINEAMNERMSAAELANAA